MPVERHGEPGDLGTHDSSGNHELQRSRAIQQHRPFGHSSNSCAFCRNGFGQRGDHESTAAEIDGFAGAYCAVDLAKGLILHSELQGIANSRPAVIYSRLLWVIQVHLQGKPTGYVAYPAINSMIY